MSNRWYVVQSKSKCEIEAAENLKNQRYTVFLPQISYTKLMRGQIVTQLSPLFPSYLFVKFDIELAKWRSILGTRGVSKLLGATDAYASPLPKGFIEDLILKADKQGLMNIKTADKIVTKYKPGDSLTIKEGLFKGLSGTCKNIQKDFAVIILALQSGTFEATLPLQLVEAAEINH